MPLFANILPNICSLLTFDFRPQLDAISAKFKIYAIGRSFLVPQREQKS